MSAQPTGLALFLSRRMSLAEWDRLGVLERELAIYRCLQQRGMRMHLVTYGDRHDERYRTRLDGMEICCNRWGLPLRVYERWLPWLHRRALSRADVFKTNQISGGLAAVRAARTLRKPLVVRCGYLPSEVSAAMCGEGSGDHQRHVLLENQTCALATCVVVTTERLARLLRERRVLPGDRIHVLPNYVDTDVFRPMPEVDPDVELLTIGRLSPEKNMAALLEAIRPLPVTLRVIGSGSEEHRLRDQFRDLESRLEWCGQLPHQALPRYLNRARLFVLPSRVEGHPKALVEAMACGRPVLGTDVAGIRELISHGVNGHLCGLTVPDLRQATGQMLARPDVCQRLGDQARRHALASFALDQVQAEEHRLLWEVIHRHRATREAA